MCGLMGFSGDPKLMVDKGYAKLALAKTKILGLYNIERGKHSCGIFADNKILKGIDDEKLFSDFISNTEIPYTSASKNYIIIGHTRMATHGVHNHENAHPFCVNDELVLAHNGVIKNIWSLCNKYKISHSEVKVDSLGLAHLINQEGFKILSEYEGFAALLMHKKSNPNSLYMYRGVSRLFKNGEMKEERPLYYMQTEEGIYISSLEKGLLAISESSSDKIKIVEANTVQRVTNGKITKSKFAVDRESINIGVSTNTHGGNPNANYPKNSTGSQTGTNSSIGNSYPHGECDSCVIENNPRTGGTQVSMFPGSGGFTAGIDDVIVPLIWYETLPLKATMNSTAKFPVCFYHTGRHWMVSDQDITIMHGNYHLTNNGKIMPFDAKESKVYYFFEGVMMRNEKCYKAALIDKDLENDEYNFAMIVSKYAEYPVCNLPCDIANRCKGASSFVKMRWYKNQNMCHNDGFIPKFSDRNYVLKSGLLYSISSQSNKREETIDITTLKEARKKAGLEKNEPNNSILPIKPESPKTQSGVVVTIPEFVKPPLRIVKGETKEPVSIDITNFCRIYDTISEARDAFTEWELKALKLYVTDVVTHEMEFKVEDLEDDSIDVQLNMWLNICIETKSTLLDTWDEKNYKDVFAYMRLAKIVISRDLSLAEAQTLCENIEMEKDDESLHDASHFHEPDNTDNEPPFIDTLPENQAGVPKQDEELSEDIDEKLEKLEQEEEIEYAIEDGIDALCDARESADELTSFDTDLSNELANVIYRGIDPLLHNVMLKLKESKNTVLYEYFVNRTSKTYSQSGIL